MQTTRDYQRIKTAVHFLQTRPDASLTELAARLHLSESHCHKLFHHWAGITPKQFQGFVRKQRALAQLRQSKPLLEASWAAGLSGPGRLHDLMIHWEAVTPVEFRRRGQGLTLSYRFFDSPLGEMLQVHSSRGLCFLGFVDASRAEALEQAQARWPAARLEYHLNQPPLSLPQLQAHRQLPPLHLWGTDFQHKIWEALLLVPPGQVCSYAQLAQASQKSSALRALGTAVGVNPLSVLIPCHRVIQSSGVFGNYHWGPERKLLLLARESSKAWLL